jgi:hypothetical protein
MPLRCRALPPIPRCGRSHRVGAPVFNVDLGAAGRVGYRLGALLEVVSRTTRGTPLTPRTVWLRRTSMGLRVSPASTVISIP